MQSEHRDECRAQSGKRTDWQPEHPIIIFKYSHNLFKTSNTVPKFFSLYLHPSALYYTPLCSETPSWVTLILVKSSLADLSWWASLVPDTNTPMILVSLCMYLVIYCLLELLLVYGVNIQHKYGFRQVSCACGWDAFNSFATISNTEIIIELVPRLRLKYCFI